MGRAGIAQDISERALSFLENIGPEENIITSEWRDCRNLAESAFYSQALIQLRNEYCKKRKCLDCRIGNKIISQGKRLKDMKSFFWNHNGKKGRMGELAAYHMLQTVYRCF
jgi:hypothetical protein